MSKTSGANGERAEVDDEAQRREMAEVQEKLDAESDGDGLGAEAGAGDETGLTEG